MICCTLKIHTTSTTSDIHSLSDFLYIFQIIMHSNIIMLFYLIERRKEENISVHWKVDETNASDHPDGKCYFNVKL